MIAPSTPNQGISKPQQLPLTLSQVQVAKYIGVSDRVFRLSEKALIACGMKIVKFPSRGKKPYKRYLTSSIEPALIRAADRGVLLGPTTPHT